jgi:hypothetical protein
MLGYGDLMFMSLNVDLGAWMWDVGCGKNSPTNKDDVGLWRLAGVREFIRWVVRELPYLFPSEWLLLEEVLTN